MAQNFENFDNFVIFPSFMYEYSENSREKYLEFPLHWSLEISPDQKIEKLELESV